MKGNSARSRRSFRVSQSECTRPHRREWSGTTAAPDAGPKLPVHTFCLQGLDGPRPLRDNKTLDGLFLMVAEEEKNIRTNPATRRDPSLLSQRRCDSSCLLARGSPYSAPDSKALFQSSSWVL